MSLWFPLDLIGATLSRTDLHRELKQYSASQHMPCQRRDSRRHWQENSPRVDFQHSVRVRKQDCDV